MRRPFELEPVSDATHVEVMETPSVTNALANDLGIAVAALPPAHRGFSNANFPTDPEGRTYHVGTKIGEVANRIVTCGDPARLRVLASMLDNGGKDATAHVSKRGFTVVTGTFQGVDISIIAIGMGFPMMDMLVREVRATTTGPLLIARLGTCGAVGRAVVGQVVVAKEGAVMVQRNWDSFGKWYGSGNAPKDYENIEDVEEDQLEVDAERAAWEAGTPPYTISKVCPADEELSNTLIERLSSNLSSSVLSGINATADSFYSSQGRTDPSFYDMNSTLVSRLPSLVPGVETLEMESFALLHIAHCAKRGKGGSKSVRATACAIVCADRKGNAFIGPEVLVRIEREAGRAVLEAVSMCPLPL